MLIKKLRSRGLLGRRKKNDQGFTLVELLVVITILGILAAVVIAAVSGIGDKGEESARKTDASIQTTAQEAYCTSENGGKFEDPLILQRDGFLSGSSGYNDVTLDRSANTENCNGTSFQLFTPRKSYEGGRPEVITGCFGTQTTFTEVPKKPIVLTQSAHELFAHLGLTGNAKVPYPEKPEARPLHLAKRMADDLAANPGADASATGVLNGYANSDFIGPPASARHILTLPAVAAQDVDFAFADRPEWMLNDPNAGGTRASYSEADVIATKPGGLKTYVGFANGGCKRLLDTDQDGNPLPRTSLEGIFADIRNIGIIFDVQERALALISELREKAAASLNKAGPGAGMKVALLRVTKNDANQDAIQVSLDNNTAGGYINLVGARNAFAGMFDGEVARRIVSDAELDAAAPQVIVIGGGTLTVGGLASECEGEKNKLRNNVALANVPAVKNDRFVCAGNLVNHHGVAGAHGLLAALANELALGPAHRGPSALP